MAQTFKTIDGDTIRQAKVGDIFEGFGYTFIKEKGNYTDAILTYVSEGFYVFHTLLSNGKKGKMSFTYYQGRIGEWHRV